MAIDTRLDALENRIAYLESLVLGKKTTFENSIDAIYLREKPEREAEPTQTTFSNYVNHYVFLTRSVTSGEINSLTLGGCLLGFLGGGIASLWFEWSWLFPPTVSIISGVFVWGGLVFNRRSLLNKAMDNKTNKNPKPLELEIKETVNTDQVIIKRLNLHPKTTSYQLSTWSKAILNGETMTHHNWTGDGLLFRHGQYKKLMSAFLVGGYAIKGVGNLPNTPTKKGIGLLKAMAQLKA